MADHDPNWSLPLPKWGQAGSYLAPATPPAVAPDAAPLVALPCVNETWWLLIMGCIAQLTNPSSWIVANDDALQHVLEDVADLQDLLTIGGSCVNPIVSLTFSGCQLVAQYADGSHSTVIDTAQLHTCVVENLPPALPPNPAGKSQDQYACNIAGFLSAELIQRTMTFARMAVQNAQTSDQFITAVIAGIGILFPEVDAADVALYAFIQGVITRTLSEIETVETDPALWSMVTCIIFNGIRADGHLTITNVATVGAGLLAMSYPAHIWVPPLLSAYWLDLGFSNLLSAQSTGAVDDVDCSNCGEWCYEWDMASISAWTVAPGYGGAYVNATTGWEGTRVNAGTPNDAMELRIVSPTLPSAPITLVRICVQYEMAGYTGAGVSIFSADTYLSGTPTNHGDFTVTNSSSPTNTCNNTEFSSSSDHVAVIMRVPFAAGAGVNIRRVQVRGQGVNPFGAQNCSF